VSEFVNKKTVLITGGSGLLAINWACAIRNRFEVILGTHSHSVKLKGITQCKLYLDDMVKLESQIDQLSPDIIVHTAGLTSVDLCEKNPSLAQKVNAEMARNIASLSDKYNIKLIHISTDHLFSDSGTLYSESSIPNPLNEYGKSKLLAEKWVTDSNNQAIIARTNFFCWGSAIRKSFSDWIINNLRDENTLNMFDDIFITPILADSLALLSHELVDNDASGIFNIVSNDRISKYDFGIKIAKHFGLSSKYIIRDQIANSNLYVKRPHDMSLDNTKVVQKLGKKVESLEVSFNNLLLQEKQGRKKELYESVI
jgi:dTDP-4-dehydrorhamnose reductase